MSSRRPTRPTTDERVRPGTMRGYRDATPGTTAIVHMVSGRAPERCAETAAMRSRAP